MKYVYPAIFSPAEEGGYAIWFPDLPGTNSQGDSWPDSIDMARSALCSWIDYLLDKGMEIPSASQPGDIAVEPGDFVTLIDADIEQFHRLRDNRAVKKTLTIPAWMDEMANNAGLSYSRVLQDAIRQKLGITDR